MPFEDLKASIYILKNQIRELEKCMIQGQMEINRNSKDIHNIFTKIFLQSHAINESLLHAAQRDYSELLPPIEEAESEFYIQAAG